MRCPLKPLKCLGCTCQICAAMCCHLSLTCIECAPLRGRASLVMTFYPKFSLARWSYKCNAIRYCTARELELTHESIGKFTRESMLYVCFCVLVGDSEKQNTHTPSSSYAKQKAVASHRTGARTEVSHVEQELCAIRRNGLASRCEPVVRQSARRPIRTVPG